MGMSASQARLLAITSRIHDVEYEAQSIQNAKIQLATQSDQVYQEYLEALDATTLTVRDTSGAVKAANFNNLYNIDGIDVGLQNQGQYRFRDSKNRLLVSDEYYNFYKENNGDTMSAEALAMLKIAPCETSYDISTVETNVLNDRLSTDSSYSKLKESLDKLISEFSEALKNSSAAEEWQQGDLQYTEITNEWENVLNGRSDISDSDMKILKQIIEDYKKQEEALRTKLYTQDAEEIYRGVYGEEENGFNEDEFYEVLRRIREIKAAGGMKGISNIDDYDADTEKGKCASSSDWLQMMVQSGKITVDISEYKNGEISFKSTGVPSDSSLEYTTTSTIDKTALAKAEAKYEYETKKLDQKDKKFDNDLSKLETERQALTAEYDSVKKVISDNIDRTFKIFS